MSIQADYSRLEKTVFHRSRVRNLRTVVVGAGAVGNEVVKILGLLGVGEMTVVDPDVVEATNLTRSVLLRSQEAAGRNKALALADAAEHLFPDSMTRGLGREIADVGFQEIVNADIIFSCVDDELARVEIAYVSSKLDIPVSDAGLGTHNHSHGRISYFPGRTSACFCCLLSSQRRRELLTLWESSFRPCWAQEGSSKGRDYPSTPTMAAIVGAMQVELGLRSLFHARETQKRNASTVEITLDEFPKLEAFSLRVSTTCPFHVLDVILTPSAGQTSETTVEELLDSVVDHEHGEPVLVLDWPICARARCSACAFTWSPMRRLAVLRRSGRCPACEGREIVEEESIRGIGRHSSWARSTLAELGLPEHHLHSIRFDSVGSR